MTHTLLVIDPDGETREIEANEGSELGKIQREVGGPLDIGMFRKGERLMQYAVYEWSITEGQPHNPTASEITQRLVHGTAVLWGVGPVGESTSYEVDDE